MYYGWATLVKKNFPLIIRNEYSFNRKTTYKYCSACTYLSYEIYFFFPTRDEYIHTYIVQFIRLYNFMNIIYVDDVHDYLCIDESYVTKFNGENSLCAQTRRFLVADYFRFDSNRYKNIYYVYRRLLCDVATEQKWSLSTKYTYECKILTSPQNCFCPKNFFYQLLILRK